MAGRMEEFGFFLSRTFATTKAKQKSWPFVPGADFVINIQDGVFLVEHYSYKEKLIRIIEGQDARSVYLTLIRNGWVSKLDHAAYLGKELTKAELSLKHNFDYLQDGA